MNAAVNAVAQRLSLRTPQRESLEILAKLCEVLTLDKGAELADELARVKQAFPQLSGFEDFERAFPSFCFALATGVGKTRLMGAFIAYLHREKQIQNFFVLAPNLTIYDKLIRDFTPNTAKYVFQGISEFAVRAPTIITGETYRSGGSVRGRGLFGHDDVHINVFNISKINSEMRGDRKPLIKQLQETIGESYFDYLSKLDDLVLLMDESHRYRASAGVRAINELKPLLGLELTATPQVERAGGIEPFRNVIYSYPLSNAIADGFVKEPAVATRKDFDERNYDAARLERLKLEDGIHIHEDTKVKLDAYARDEGKSRVKPFMLIIGRDTEHANALLALIESPEFFGGNYKGKAITVHSNLKGEEKDETVQQLIGVESPTNPTEIVIHVNMLREGWDVNNLFTIVPLRAANSQTLVEQSIGRGLRLPYGARTGIEALDTLTIVAHDHFQKIVEYARSPNSIVRGGMKIRYVDEKRTKVLVNKPEFQRVIDGDAAALPVPGASTQAKLFDTPREREIARITMDEIREFHRLPRSENLTNEEVQRELVARVSARLSPAQEVLGCVVERVDLGATVAKAVDLRNRLSIDIPRVSVLPKTKVFGRYESFALDLHSVHMQPVKHEILIETLQKNQRRYLNSGDGIVAEDRLENYVVRGLSDYDDVSYDDHNELLYDLAGQVVTHLRSYLASDDDVKNVLQHQQDALVQLVHGQMHAHFVDSDVEYEASVKEGFVTHEPESPTIAEDESIRDFRVPVSDAANIRSMAFGGFSRCIYGVQKFDSNPERVMAVILDRDAQKWFRPKKADITIYFSGDERYEPDFVAEATAAKYLIEVKRDDEIADPIVLAKASAATVWCEHATEHALKHGAKPWKYLLIPASAVAENKSLAGFAATYERKSIV